MHRASHHLLFKWSCPWCEVADRQILSGTWGGRYDVFARHKSPPNVVITWQSSNIFTRLPWGLRFSLKIFNLIWGLINKENQRDLELWCKKTKFGSASRVLTSLTPMPSLIVSNQRGRNEPRGSSFGLISFFGSKTNQPITSGLLLGRGIFIGVGA